MRHTRCCELQKITDRIARGKYALTQERRKICCALLAVATLWMSYVPSSSRGAAAPSPARPSGPIEFRDATKQAGIHFKHNSGAFGKKYLPETTGAGCAFFDFDGDGWPDILLVNGKDFTPGGHPTTAARLASRRPATITSASPGHTHRKSRQK